MLRHKVNGDLGELIQKDGKMVVRVVRKTRRDLVPYIDTEWREEQLVRPLTPVQIAQVAHEADRKLCYFLGLHSEARREWPSIDEDERIELVKKGPRASKERNDLWDMVCETLKDIAR